jgi:hypothetical protein
LIEKTVNEFLKLQNGERKKTTAAEENERGGRCHRLRIHEG